MILNVMSTFYSVYSDGDWRSIARLSMAHLNASAAREKDDDFLVSLPLKKAEE